jgi:hypothetical protein
MSSGEHNHNLLITLVSIGIGILLINTILLVSHSKDVKKMQTHSQFHNFQDARPRQENYQQENFSSDRRQVGMWDNGGVYNGIGVDNNQFETKLAPSCSGYGERRRARDNMPFNNDSNLYK